MDNNILYIRSKRELLQLIDKQIDLIPEYFMHDFKHDYEIYRKRLKKNKVFYEQAKWIDGFVEKNFEEIPIVKEKLYTRKEILWHIVHNILLFLFFALVTFAYSHFPRGRRYLGGVFSVNFALLCGPGALLGAYIGIYLYTRYKTTRISSAKLTNIPLLDYYDFLLTVKKRIKSISDKEAYCMLKMYIQCFS